MVRYPHTGEVLTATTTKDADGHKIEGAPKKESVICRFEPEYMGKNGDRKGTVYLPLSEASKLSTEHASFELSGRRYRVTDVHIMQSHIEVWVE